MTDSCDYQPEGIHPNDVTVYQKRNRTITLNIEDPDDEWGDITGSLLWFSVKSDSAKDDTDAIITKKNADNGGADTQMEIITATGVLKVVRVYIVPGDTNPDTDDPPANALALPGDYDMDAVIELPSGDRLQLLEPARFTIKRPTTLTVNPVP